jgi:hypothetical protein
MQPRADFRTRLFCAQIRWHFTAVRLGRWPRADKGMFAATNKHLQAGMALNGENKFPSGRFHCPPGLASVPRTMLPY